MTLANGSIESVALDWLLLAEGGGVSTFRLIAQPGAGSEAWLFGGGVLFHVEQYLWWPMLKGKMVENDWEGARDALYEEMGASWPYHIEMKVDKVLGMTGRPVPVCVARAYLYDMKEEKCVIAQSECHGVEHFKGSIPRAQYVALYELWSLLERREDLNTSLMGIGPA